SCCDIAGKKRRRAGEASLILPERGQSPKGKLTLLEGGKIPTIPCLAQDRGHRAMGHPSPSPHLLTHTSTGSGLLSHPWATYISPSPQSHSPLLRCHLSHT
ncbi:hypothetical protein KUCAC02_004676, partial [Chaenocephalus aceratus]